METQALTTMVIAKVLVTVITSYFFYLVLKTPPKQEPDSYSENDEEVR
jgi:hypothetical protein